RDEMAVALAKLGKLMRFTVTVVDPLLAADDLPDADRVLHALDFSVLAANPDRNVVVASRGTCDEEAIEEALAASSPYIALVAKKKRGDEIVRSLRMKGTQAEQSASPPPPPAPHIPHP